MTRIIQHNEQRILSMKASFIRSNASSLKFFVSTRSTSKSSVPTHLSFITTLTCLTGLRVSTLLKVLLFSNLNFCDFKGEVMTCARLRFDFLGVGVGDGTSECSVSKELVAIIFRFLEVGLGGVESSAEAL